MLERTRGAGKHNGGAKSLRRQVFIASGKKPIFSQKVGIITPNVSGKVDDKIGLFDFTDERRFDILSCYNGMVLFLSHFQIGSERKIVIKAHWQADDIEFLAESRRKLHGRRNLCTREHAPQFFKKGSIM